MKRNIRSFRVNHFKKTAFLVAVFAILSTFAWFAYDRIKNDNEANAVSVINPAYQANQDLKVLVVEVNPHLNSVAGSPKAADLLFGEDIARTVVDEQVADLNFSYNSQLALC